MEVPVSKKNGIYVGLAHILLAVLIGFCVLAAVGLTVGFTRRSCPSSTATTTTIRPSTPTPQTSSTSTTGPTSTQPAVTSTSTSRPAGTTGTTTPPIDMSKYRLPGDVIPVNYNLDMKVYFDLVIEEFANSSQERFEGREVITIRVLNVTSRIVFHCDSSLRILEDSVRLTSKATGQTTVIRANQHYYDENQFYKIDLDAPLALGEYDLQLDYQGDFGSASNLVGFYKASYREDGLTKQVAATDFEPLDARKAFPAFDEPLYKATYEIAIEHPMGSLALSNWPESPRQVINGNRYRTTFQKTSPMPTYIVAWSITPDDYGVVETMSQRGTPIRIRARKSAVDKGLLNFAAEVSKQVVDFFQNVYFDSTLNAVPPKIDQLALPDFNSGAMENWGHINYKETNLFFSDDANSESTKQSVASVIAHELAHFWFGNLVTCKWWDEIWLNEAMAQFLQNKAIHSIYPAWDLDNQVITSVLIPVMFDDGIQSTVPIENPVITSEQIGAVFNSITYSKGASVLRMLESTVGNENFRQGLNSFLKANEFGSAESSFFYNTLVLPADMNGTTPSEFMATWIKQTNYPQIGVIMGTNPEGNTRAYFIQRRFLMSPQVLPDIDFPSPYNFKWQVYLKCRAGGIGPNQHLAGDIREFNLFLRAESAQIDLDRRYSWIKCNNDFRGYYVMDYSAQLLLAFDEILATNKDVFSVADRANLIHSTFILSYTGAKSYASVSFLGGYLEYSEDQLVPWQTFFYHMTKVGSLLDHRSGFQELKDFAVGISKPFAERIDAWSSEGDHSQRLLKTAIINFLCRMQDAEDLRRATSFFESLSGFYFILPSDVANNIPPYLRDIVYKYHIQNSYNYVDWIRMNSLYGLTVNAQERSQALNAMSFTRLAWILDTLLQSLVTPNPGLFPITPQDFFTIINAVSRNPTGRHVAWWFIRYRWYQIQDIVGYRSRGLANTVKTVCETFENEFLLEQMNSFFSTTQPGVGSAQRQTALEIVKHNIYWVENREEDIMKNLFEPRAKSMKSAQAESLINIQ